VSERLLETVERETGSPVSGSVLWLHGLGADGYDFEPIIPELAPPAAALRFVMPHAPIRPVTINGGMAMRAWFDVLALDRDSPQDERGIREAAEQVRALIRRENARGVPTERIVLAGFSQGGALALHTGLRLPQRLAGIIGLSTFLPLAGALDAEAHPANRETSFFLAHGTLDPLVPLSLGETTRDWLAERGYAVNWRSYPIPHAVSPQEIADVRAFIAAVTTWAAAPRA